MTFEALDVDAAGAARELAATMHDQVLGELKRKGAVVGLSGGIDSSVVAALAVCALGRERVFGLLLPEKESSADSLRLGRLMATRLGIETAIEDVTGILEAAGCYRRRDEAIRILIPEYGPGFHAKIALPEAAVGSAYAVPSVVAQSPDGRMHRARLTSEAARAITAANNFKQRARKMIEYYHADRLSYAVLGTPNRLEYDQGFFVKNGDGAADLKPLARLYKSQVYQLAEQLGVPEEIRLRQPTTDTWPLAQSQEEFYFTLPYRQMDLCLYGKDHGIEPALIAAELGLPTSLIERIYRTIDAKRRAARYLHAPPLLSKTDDRSALGTPLKPIPPV